MSRTPSGIRLALYAVSMWLIMAGTYGLVIHDNALGWWFLFGGAVSVALYDLPED